MDIESDSDTWEDFFGKCCKFVEPASRSEISDWWQREMTQQDSDDCVTRGWSKGSAYAAITSGTCAKVLLSRQALHLCVCVCARITFVCPKMANTHTCAQQQSLALSFHSTDNCTILEVEVRFAVTGSSSMIFALFACVFRLALSHSLFVRL